MARGWESKSVEAQQSEAAEKPSKVRSPRTPEQIALAKKREGLELSRKRVVQQLEAAQNPRYQKMLQDAIAELDKQLSKLL